MGHSCPIFKCLLVFQSAMQHSLLVSLPNWGGGGFVSLQLGPAHPNWSKFEIWGWSGLVWGLYLGHPHQSSFRVLPRGAHHCLMLKNFRLGSATVKPMYLELLGDIVSVAHILLLNLFVFFLLFLRFLQLYTVLKTGNKYCRVLLIDGEPSTTRAFFLIATAPPSSSGVWLK